ncbi:hypothetical protein NQ318_017736 [Aromia moschata]|uniref:Uncharacterized protein n=1 Tax=Aromia moschata TaxID=1265417 RepID=A0AAV8XQE8_9CUCU|nr:hypothetical protein NQ318_017736 [Aromia moschata]
MRHEFGINKKKINIIIVDDLDWMNILLFQEMGTIPQLSVIKGATRAVTPNLLNRLFENVADEIADNNALIFNDKQARTDEAV